jgi:hypothetical protein
MTTCGVSSDAQKEMQKPRLWPVVYSGSFFPDGMLP